MTNKLENRNIEALIFPMDYLNITQGENGYGVVPEHQTHQGTFAIDTAGKDTGIDTLYAPCSMTCKFVDSAANGNACCFESLNPVALADGTVDYVTMLFIHDNDISNITVNKEFKQGDVFYEEGTAGYAKGNHVHMEIAKGRFTNAYVENDKGVWMLPNSTHIYTTYWVTNKTIILSNMGYSFKVYNDGPFDPSGKPNGWNQYNDDWYYVENNKCVVGWKNISGSWFYLQEDGKMKTGWLALEKDWYWMNPENGIMQVNVFVDDDKFYVGADGKMVRTGWTLIGSNYYYFKDKNRDTDSRYASFADGQKVTSTWIPGSSWFYVLSNGIMAQNCQIRENGKYFAFNNSGACLNSSGQTTAYNTTTYPIKS